MKKVGILGGTYNPPHIGHLIIANEVKHALQLDEVRLMPTSLPPHKESVQQVTKAQRLQMVAEAVKNTKGISVSDFEIARGGISYTFDTMNVLTTQEPDTDFYFIIGGDMIDQLNTWHRIDELIDIVKFVGVNRPGWKSNTSYPVIMVDIPEIDLSSTLIRERLVRGGTVQFLIPKAVETYIHKEGLYGTH